MAEPPKRRRGPSDPFKAAEELFRPVAPKLPDAPAGPAAPPGVKETVTLRIDKDILDHFQEDGPGWQERINAALRRVIGG